MYFPGAEHDAEESIGPSLRSGSHMVGGMEKVILSEPSEKSAFPPRQTRVALPTIEDSLLASHYS